MVFPHGYGALPAPIGGIMYFLPLPSRLTNMAILATGFALTFASAVYFFAWNWYGMPEAIRFFLTGGVSALCLALSFFAERRGLMRAAAIALLGTALFIGLFWVTFGQIFQSGATAWELCLVWAASIVPLFLLRRNASLWNLIIALLFIASWGNILSQALVYTHVRELHLLPMLLTAAGGCAIALFPQLRRRSPYGLNVWFALPLTLLLATATALCLQFILFHPSRHAGIAELAAGPATIVIVLAAALRSRHALTLCEAALAFVVVLNALLLRGFDHLSSAKLAFLFTVANLIFTFLLAIALPRLRQNLTSTAFPCRLLSLVPSFLGGFIAAISFIALITLTFLEHTAVLLGSGLAFMVCGIVFWRMRGKNVFLSVLSATIVSGGALCFHISLLNHDSAIITASVWAAALSIYILINSAVLRFFFLFWALVTGIFFLPQTMGVSPCLFLAFLLFLPLAAAAFGRFPRGVLRPAAFACLCAFPAMPLVMAEITNGKTGERILITLAALNLVLLLFRQIPKPCSFAFPKLGKTTAGLAAILSLWFFSPLESLFSLNLIFAGVGNTPNHAADEVETTPAFDKALTVLGIISLTASLVFFYYGIDHSFPLENMAMAVFKSATPFLNMTMAAGIPGICLIGIGMWAEGSNKPKAHKKPETPQFPPILRHALPFAIFASLMTGAACMAIADRKNLLQSGDEILLSLRPRDPREFMIGDYMDLTYDIERDFPAEGSICMPLSVDELGIARPMPNSIKKGDCKGVPAPAVFVEASSHGFARLRLPHRYYFEHGLAFVYADAAFAVLRCDKNNNCLLKGLANADRRPILPPKR